MSRDYEVILVVSPELNEEALAKVQAQFNDAVSRHQGQVLESVPLGKRKLSYKIGRQTEGIYLQIWLKMPPQEIVNLKKAVTLMESVIRLMIVQGSRLSGAVKLGTEKNESAVELRAPASEEV